LLLVLGEGGAAVFLAENEERFADNSPIDEEEALVTGFGTSDRVRERERVEEVVKEARPTGSADNLNQNKQTNKQTRKKIIRTLPGPND
jgi:hypothetical protein